jgi:hypothetical protein
VKLDTTFLSFFHCYVAELLFSIPNLPYFAMSVKFMLSQKLTVKNSRHEM